MDPSARHRSSALGGGPSPALTQLLTSYVPGYAVLVKFLSARLGINADKILAVIGFWFAGWAGLGYLKNTVIPRVIATFTSSITVSAHEPIYHHIFQWLRLKGVFNAATDLRIEGRGDAFAAAATQDPHGYSDTLVAAYAHRHALRYASYQGSSPPEQPETDSVKPVTPNTELFHFRTSNENKPPTYIPNHGSHYFFHAWTLYMVTCNRDNLKLTCLGYSTQPVKDLIAAIHASVKERKKKVVDVYRSSSSGNWIAVASRIGRTLETITLDYKLKLELVTDVQSFIQPGQAAWYAARGIPYRRGYLFKGPPGTGKTSFARALAGTFGLPIYVVDLARSNFHEDSLTHLIESLPSRCVLVIEDIDAVASNRESDEELAQNDDDFRMHRGYRITLSGLLNAIDGMLSHEGHLLIMTTNHPDKLDPALTRPGRVDKMVEFPLTMREQNIELFTRMFASHLPTAAAPVKTIADACRPHTPVIGASCQFTTLEDLYMFAHAFADRVPENVFSPAAVQDYLLEHVRDPQASIDGAQAWVIAQRDAFKSAEERKIQLADQLQTAGSSLTASSQIPRVDASPQALCEFENPNIAEARRVFERLKIEMGPNFVVSGPAYKHYGYKLN